MVRETLLKLLEISGALDEYVILKEDEKGRYIEYAFKEGRSRTTVVFHGMTSHTR